MDNGLLGLTLKRLENSIIFNLPDGRKIEIVLSKHKGANSSVILISAPKDISIDRGTYKDFHKDEQSR